MGCKRAFLHFVSTAFPPPCPQSCLRFANHPPEGQGRRCGQSLKCQWRVLAMGTSFFQPNPPPAKLILLAGAWRLFGLPAQLVPTAPACPPGFLGLYHHGGRRQSCCMVVPMWGRGRRRRWSKLEKAAGGGGCPVEAESGQWGCQPFGSVPRALEAPFLPSRELAGTTAGGPIWRWGGGCWVSGGHGIKPLCTS